MTKVLLTILLIALSIQLLGQQNENAVSQTGSNSFKFICVSGIYNNFPMLDTSNHNELIKHLLKEVEAEKPEFVIVSDVANDQLSKSPITESIIYHSEGYYPGWLKIMSQFKLNFYSVFGPNEVGGELWNEQKTKVFDLYKTQYNKYLQMPHTGSKGFYYWIAYKNLLVAVLDTYDKPVEIKNKLQPNIRQEQLDWLELTLKSHYWFKHKIVIAYSSRILENDFHDYVKGLEAISGKEKVLKGILEKNNVEYFLTFDDLPVSQKSPDGFQLIQFPASKNSSDKLQYLIFYVSDKGIEFRKK